MFYQNGEWTDFPRDMFDSMKNELREKKTVIDVKLNGPHCLIDLLHMLQLDLETGLQQPIAWIDEAGKCLPTGNVCQRR